MPTAIPIPIYKGPSSKPFAGKVTKFLNPLPILFAILIGVEMSVKEPMIEKSYCLML